MKIKKKKIVYFFMQKIYEFLCISCLKLFTLSIYEVIKFNLTSKLINVSLSGDKELHKLKLGIVSIVLYFKR